MLLCHNCLSKPRCVSIVSSQKCVVELTLGYCISGYMVNLAQVTKTNVFVKYSTKLEIVCFDSYRNFIEILRHLHFFLYFLFLSALIGVVIKSALKEILLSLLLKSGIGLSNG